MTCTNSAAKAKVILGNLYSKNKEDMYLHLKVSEMRYYSLFFFLLTIYQNWLFSCWRIGQIVLFEVLFCVFLCLVIFFMFQIISKFCSWTHIFLSRKDSPLGSFYLQTKTMQVCPNFSEFASWSQGRNWVSSAFERTNQKKTLQKKTCNKVALFWSLGNKMVLPHLKIEG